MKVYIAASWRHEHAVRMLTRLLRTRGHAVVSFVEEAGRDEELVNNPNRKTLDEWVWGASGLQKFRYDTSGATEADAVVYIGPSGTDAWAEVGAAWASGVPVYGLWAKGEPAGLMRRMVTWFPTHNDLIQRLSGDEDCLCNAVATPRKAREKGDFTTETRRTRRTTEMP